MREKHTPAEVAAAEEKSLRAWRMLDKYSLTYPWLVKQLRVWEGLTVDRSTLSRALNGTRRFGQYDEYVAAALRVLTRYGEMYGERTPTAE